MTKRNLFAEITEGFEALAEERAGRKTLRTHEVEWLPAPRVDAADIIALRQRLHLSRPLCAGHEMPPVRSAPRQRPPVATPRELAVPYPGD